MKHYERWEERVKKNRMIKKCCDICGYTVTGHVFHNDWATERGDIKEVPEELLKVGQGWPEGGRNKMYSVDICPDCMKNKVFPFIESLGAKIEVSEVDW